MIDKGRQSILGIYVDAVDYETAVQRIHRAAGGGEAYSVSALAVHGVMTGVQDEQHKFRLNNFDMIVPDGQPVRWAMNLLHNTGLKDRVYGPELTLRTLAMAAESGLPIYLYGSTAEILDGMKASLKRRFPALTVAGSEPSKFRELAPAECTDLADRIVQSGAKLLFVGLGCPRQEIFAFEMHSLLPMPVLAVGAAFAFISGELAQAPPRMQAAGLEWLYRLTREPSRLWRRYLLLNPYYVFLLAGQWIGVKFGTAGIAPVTAHRYG